MEDAEAQVPEAAGECAYIGLGVRLGGEGLQRTLWPQLLLVIGVWWLAEGKNNIPWLPSQTGLAPRTKGMSSRNCEPLPCTETTQTFVLVTAAHFTSMGTQAEEELVWFFPKTKGITYRISSKRQSSTSCCSQYHILTPYTCDWHDLAFYDPWSFITPIKKTEPTNNKIRIQALLQQKS